MKQIVLASSSRYRQAQLSSLGIPFICHSADIDETPYNNEPIDSMALRLATQKAEAVSRFYPNALIIGCDQTASCEGHHIGKPNNRDNAMTQLRFLQGKQVYFYSAIVLIDTHSQEIQSDTVITRVQYRSLTAVQIKNYLERDTPFDCTGSFKSEALGIALLDSISSNDPSALIGLPLISATRLLAHAGIDVLS